jgi:predicted ATPase
MGKTRLCKQVAAELVDEFPDGAWLVDCESLLETHELLAGISNVFPFGSQSNSKDGLIESLQRRRLLVVLDCFENTVTNAPLVDELVESVPGLHVLLTSRILLGVPREHEYPLRPMAVSAKSGETADSMRLFAEAAGHAIDGFQITSKNKKLLREICASLEGVPLALVLAAGRLRHMGLAELIQQVNEQPVATLRRRTGGIERHANIESVVAGSFNLLPIAERQMLCKLAILVGSFTVTDGAAVCKISETALIAWLSDLRDHSLIHLIRDETTTQVHDCHTISKVK